MQQSYYERLAQSNRSRDEQARAPLADLDRPTYGDKRHWIVTRNERYGAGWIVEAYVQAVWLTKWLQDGNLLCSLPQHIAPRCPLGFGHVEVLECFDASNLSGAQVQIKVTWPAGELAL